VGSWVLYDLANTIFALGVSGLYFASWLAERNTPDLALSLATNAAMIAVIVLAPWLGARTDHVGHRVRYLIPTTLVAVGGTFFIATFDVTGSLVLFAVALVGFNLGTIVYDAVLPDVSLPGTQGRISGIGAAVGYLGSVIAVVVGVVLLPDQGSDADYAAVFRTIAVLFLLLAIPAFLFIRERPRSASPGPPPSLRTAFDGLIRTWRRAARYEGVLAFLIGRFLYADAVNTLTGGFLTIYVKTELGFTNSEVRTLLGLAIVAAIGGGAIGSLWTDRVGPRRMLHLALYCWMVGMVAGVVAAMGGWKDLTWTVGAIGGLGLGMTGTADRVYMARISPPRYLGEFYGIYATVGRFATLLGPLLWGLIVSVFGLPREVALGTLLLFLVAGRIVLSRVDDTPRLWSAADSIDSS
jgi:UMF1 family MFS transporter